MATRYYLQNEAPGFTPTTVYGTWGIAYVGNDRALGTAHSGAKLSQQSATAGSNPGSRPLVRFTSPPLSGAGSIQDMDTMIGAHEDNAADNAYTKVLGYITVGDTDVVRAVFCDWADTATEWGTAYATNGHGQSPTVTPKNYLDGDRIVLIVGATYNADTLERLLTLYYGGLVAEEDLVDGGNGYAATGYIDITFGAVIPPPIYYVDAVDGDDGAAGTSWGAAWQTIAKVNAAEIESGATVLFGNNAIHRGQIEAQDGVIYGRHPVAANPAKALILGSVDLSLTADWTLHAAGIYKTTATRAADIGNLIFNFEASCGFKRFSLGALADQGDFFYDPATDLVYLRSASDPGSFYTHIEAALFIDGILLYASDWSVGRTDVTVQDLDFRYQGRSAIVPWGDGADACDGCTIEDVDISYVGGCDFGGGVRAGNGINAIRSVANLIVRRVRADNIYDAAFTQQEQLAADVCEHQSWTELTATNCEYGWEFFSAGGDVDDLVVDGCSFTRNGYGWGHEQRPDAAFGTGARFDAYEGATYTNCRFTNNLIGPSTEQHIYVFKLPEAIAGWDIDHNAYTPDGPLFRVDWGDHDYTFAEWQTASGMDANSEIQSTPTASTCAAPFAALGFI